MKIKTTSRLAWRPKRRKEQGKALTWVIVAVLFGAAAGGIWWWKHRQADQGGEGQASARQGAWGEAGGKTGAKAGGQSGPGGQRMGRGGGMQAVAVMQAGLRDIHVTVSAIGSLIASNTAVVRAQVNGVLQQVHFKEGQEVRAGQTLAQIDPRSFQAALQQAEGALARDKAQLDNAKLDLERYRGLLAKDALPKQQVDTQEALVRQLEGTVRTDKANVESARLQVTYTKVQAPISGRVGLRQVDIGNVVQTGDANGIVSITQTRPMALVFSVPASVLPKIAPSLRQGRHLRVQAVDPATRETLADGEVTTLDNAIDSATDTIKIKALFPNEQDTLFPNQSVSVTLQVETLSQTLAVPTSAVLKGANGNYVFVVDAESKVSTRNVKPGVTDGAWTAVSGALNVGDRVVVDGVDRLRDGAKVEVVAADPSQRGAAKKGEEAQGRRSRMDDLPPDVAAKVKAMSPDERRAWFQQHRRASDASQR